MLLWDIIRDWFVQYVWGGVNSRLTVYEGFIGNVFNKDGSGVSTAYTAGLLVPINGFIDSDYTGEVSYIALGDWLSTTSTIIVLIALSIFLFLVVRYLFRLTSGLIRGR